MDYQVDTGAEGIVFRVRGRVDEASWVEFGEGLNGAVRQARDAGIATVAIDLGQLDYMSSRGLRALTVAKRQADEAGIAVHLVAPNAVMREILAISRYDKLFTIIDRPGA